MSKVISQETFDEVVQENVVDFAMSPVEAKEETVKQFEAQGINLANIIKDLSIDEATGKPILNETIEKLKMQIAEKSLDTEMQLNHLEILDAECKKSLAHRVLAGKNGAHDVLLSVIERALSDNCNELENQKTIVKCLLALNSLLHKQPDLFDAKALEIVKKLIEIRASDTEEQENIIYLTLQWLQKVCIMHEMNRQAIMGADIVKKLKPLLAYKNNSRLLCELLAVFRFLVLDDDIRVEFGKAHEHARQIASEVLLDLVQLLPVNDDAEVLSDLILTIGALAVRQEFCTAIDDADGLKLVFDIMSKHQESVRLNRESLKLLRALAGHDTVKAHIVQQGVAPVVKQVLETHSSNENVVAAALACISTLTLRVKEHSAAFFETGIAEIIVECIRSHAKHKIVQRNGAWAIRNMVSRSRNQCDTWLSFGIEDLLNDALNTHPSIAQDVKAALRDLGCKVHLREEWTGIAEKKIAA